MGGNGSTTIIKKWHSRFVCVKDRQILHTFTSKDCSLKKLSAWVCPLTFYMDTVESDTYLIGSLDHEYITVDIDCILPTTLLTSKREPERVPLEQELLESYKRCTRFRLAVSCLIHFCWSLGPGTSLIAQSTNKFLVISHITFPHERIWFICTLSL